MKGMEYLVPSVNILKLAEESQSSAYDCEFVALAKQFDLELVTSDALIIQKFSDTAVHMSEFIKARWGMPIEFFKQNRVSNFAKEAC